MKQIWSISGYLAVKEVWRNRGRFLLVSLVIGLITLLVLFIAALGEGLGNGNREYISKLDADLVVYQAKSDFLIGASRLGRASLAAVRRVEGVQDVGMLGAANANLILPGQEEPLKAAMLGVEPGRPGEPQVVKGQQLSTDSAKEVILDRNTAVRSKLDVGDTLTVRTTQGTNDEFYELRVVGITDGQQYSLQPSIFVPFYTWDYIRPKSEAEVNRSNPVANAFLVKVANPAQVDEVS
jgi:putative ABC transport system permease protein